MNMHAGPSFAPAWFLIAIVGFAVVAGIIFIVRALGNRSGQGVAWTLAGVVAVGLFMAMVSFRTSHEVETRRMVLQHSSSLNSDQHRFGHEVHETPPKVVVTPTIDLSHESGDKSPEKSTAIVGPEATTFIPEASQAKPVSKPAWLTQGTRRSPGLVLLPITSELFATIQEGQADLEARIAAAIAQEIERETGEPITLSLTPQEIQSFLSERYVEEVSLSQGSWYRVHGLLKLDEQRFANLHGRLHPERLMNRLKTLGSSFGGLMLALGAGYLILRRQPRVVDPTLETFSTT